MLSFDRLGNRRYLLPVLAVIVFGCVFSLVVAPMLRATPRDVPIAVASLDTGATTPAGDLNLGATLVGQLTAAAAAAGDAAPIAWTQLDSEAAVDAALDDNEYYGAVVIPADFSQAQAAAQAGTGEAPAVRVIINQGKNPMLAATMQQAIAAVFTQAGVKTTVELVHAAAIGGGPTAALMGSQMLIMPLVMMTMGGTLLLFLTLRPPKTATRSEKLKAYGRQVAYAAVLSLVVACAAVLTVTWIGGLSLPFGTLTLFLWLGCFAIMALFLGTLSLAVPLGALVIVLVFAGGMSSAMLAREMLPQFWQGWIYPWAPQHYLALGDSQIIYMGSGAWTDGSLPLLITALVGLVVLLLAALVPARPPRPAGTAAAAEAPAAA
ncbi:MAG: ABC transporter permease [Propionibacteriaceae bacterium]|jgi:hypothetical protein|nr:ABC transporter permease [Propionibacteriaceae bacterium]